MQKTQRVSSQSKLAGKIDDLSDVRCVCESLGGCGQRFALEVVELVLFIEVSSDGGAVYEECPIFFRELRVSGRCEALESYPR